MSKDEINNKYKSDSDISGPEFESPESIQALDIAKTKTHHYVKSIGQLISKHAKPIIKAEKSHPQTLYTEPVTLKNKFLLAFLRATPLVLIVLFGVSFFWDFSGISFTIWNTVYVFEGLLRILSVSGLIGFFTNWLAITMLFKPAKKRPILGHGLIPAQKDRIAYRLASAISRDLINPEIIKRKIHDSNIISRYRQLATDYIKNIIDDPEFRYELKNLATDYVRELIADPTIRTSLAGTILKQIEESIESKSLEKLAFRTYTFIKGREAQKLIEELLDNLPESFERGLDKVDHLLDELPKNMEQNSEAIEDTVTKLLYKLVNQLDVHALVEQNIKELDESRLENLIKGSTNEQLHYIQYLGAVLGTVGGLVIWSPLLSISFLGLLTSCILLLDIGLHKIMQS